MVIFMEGLEDVLGWILQIGFIRQCKRDNFLITGDDTEGSTFFLFETETHRGELNLNVFL